MGEQKIYLLLTDTGTIFTRMIKLYTRKPYNHASISFDFKLNNVYSFGRKKPRNPFFGGFVKENVRNDLFLNARCAIYSITVTEQQLKNLKESIQRFEEERESYHYNLIGLAGVVLNRPICRENRFFCSEFVATILENSGILAFTKPVHLITPYDFQMNDSLKLVYQGELLSYLEHTEEDKHLSVANVLTLQKII